MGAAEEGGKEAEEHGAGEADVSAHGGSVGGGYAAESLYAEGQGQGQCDDAGGHSAKQVAFEIAKEVHDTIA